MQRRYGFPYMVIHRSDLHATFLRACQRAGVELLTDVKVTAYEQVEGGARAISDGRADEAEVVIAADGMHSVARGYLVDDEPQSSAYVAYRGAVPMAQVMDNEVSLQDVVVYIGPRCHFVQYPLRQGEMFNQVAVFESPKALRGEEDWGTPDELDGAFADTVPQDPRRAQAHVAGQVVADVRPAADPELGQRPRRAPGDSAHAAPSVPGPGGGHGHRGRVGAGRAGRGGGRPGGNGGAPTGTGRRARRLPGRAPRALPARRPDRS